MFGLLNSQIYELQQTELKNNNNNIISKNHHHQQNHQQQEKMKVTTNFIEKFIIKSEVLAGNTMPVDLKNSFDTMKHFKNNNQQQQNHLSSLINNNNCNNSKGGQHQDEGINDNIPVTLKSKELNVKHEKMLTKDFDNNRAVINRSGSSSSSSNYCDGNGITNNNDNEKKLKRNLLNGELNGNGNYKNNNNKENLNKTTNNLVEFSKSPTTSELSGINSDSNTKTINNTTTTAIDIMQRKKFMQMITFLDQQNQRLEKELAKEKRRRAEELSRIIKSLLCFEAKLKSEKKVINQKLYDKDDEIARLVRLNRILRKQCFKIDESIECTDDDKEINNIEDITNNGINDDGGGGEECKYPEALFCPNCRKEFYGLDVKEIGKDGRIIKGDHHHNGSTEHGSSSDETLSSSFYGARRSIRYTSKRTFGTFRDYMRSRCLNIDDPNLDNSEENGSILSRDESQTSYEKMNYSRTIDRIHGVRRVSSFEFDSENSENRSRKNFSSSGPETDHDHSPHEEVEEDDVFYPTQTNFSKNSQRNEFNELSSIMPVQKFETSTDDWYASASDQDDEQDINVRTTKSYGYNVGVNPVLECVNQILLQQSMEECLINNNDNTTNSSAEINTVNNNGPTSLDSNDNNSGGSINGGNLSGGSTASKDNGVTGTRKRVHFSTKNSMVHVPRDDDDDDDSINMLNHHTISSNSVVLIDQKSSDQNFNYESIYSNEYEPIGSEHNSSNLYVDMDGSKLGQDDQQRCNELNKHLKQPPALPPKPANLIKFKRALKNNLTSTQEDIEHEQQIVCNLINKNDDSIKINNNNVIEPDYCSISELSENLTTCVQIVADVHKIPENILSSSSSSSSSSSASSLCGSSTTSDAEIFADIPKLPNVAAIIAPKQNNNNNNKFINNDNYVTKSSSPKKDDLLVTSISSAFAISPSQQQQQQQQHFRPKSPGQVKRQHVPNILAEINKKIQNNNINNNGLLNPLSPTKSSHHNNLITIPISPKKLNIQSHNHHQHQLTPILKQRNQKSNQKITSTVKSSSLTDDQQNKLQIQEEFDWYNLDAEYGKSSSSLSSSIIQSSDVNKSDILNLNEMDELILSNNNNNTSGNNNNDNLNNPNDSIEYNLDEEFSLCNQTDDLLIHDNDNSIHENVMVNLNSNNDDDNDASKNDLITTNLENGFATIIDDTPANRKNVKRKENFVKFIDTAGLSTKPLPRQRKIYFSGPFI